MLYLIITEVVVMRYGLEESPDVSRKYADWAMYSDVTLDLING